MLTIKSNLKLSCITVIVDIMNYEKNTIETYLNKISENSRTTYKSIIKGYFNIIKKDPEKYIVTGFEYFDNGERKDVLEKYYADLEKYSNAIKNIPPKTIRNRFAGIKKYFTTFHIDFPNQRWKDLNSQTGARKAYTKTKKCTPTVEDLRFILSEARLRQNALITFASSTGLRIDEAVKVKISDINWENRSIIAKRKGGYYGIVFFTEECKKILDEWLSKRKDYIKNKRRKSKFVRDGKQTKEDDRLFPFAENNARDMWNNLLERAGKPYNERVVVNKKHVNKKGKSYKRYTYNFQCLRRFWFSQLEGSRAPKSHIDAIGAHSSELDSTYKQITSHTDKLAKKYKETYDQYSGCLNIFSDYEKVKSEIGNKFSYQNRMIQNLKDENSYLNNEIEELKKKVSTEITTTHFAVQQSVDTEKGSDKIIGELQAQIKELAKQFKTLERKYRE